MGRTIFKDNTVQTGFRVKIPKAIIDTLEIKIRDKIKIEFDPDKREIIIKEEEKRKGK